MLAQAVESYLAVRRAVGFAFKSEGSLLRSFATFSEARGEPSVRSPIAIEWAGLARSVPQRARRLDLVIRFARYIRAEDERHELPPAVFGGETSPRPVPYILAEDTIRQLVHAASRAGYRTLRRETYRTLFALLACTGLRVSEAIRLRYEDIRPGRARHSTHQIPEESPRSFARDRTGRPRTVSGAGAPVRALR